MQLVGTYQVFGLLLDITQFVGRNQLGRNRGIDDVEQRFGSHILSHITHQIANQRFGHTSIHTIHRHVVAIIGGPSQCQLRQVACTNHNRILLISHIHQYLGALAGLRVLVGDIVNAGVVLDIAEVLGNSSSNADFANGNTQRLHQFNGIVIGAIGSSETWHRDTDDALTIET